MNGIHLFQNSSNFDTFGPGRIIFEQGQSGDLMYIVKEGEVEIRTDNKSVGKVSAGEMLGEMVLITGEVRSATAIAKTECKLVAINKDRFNFLLQNTLYFANSIMQIMAFRLRHMNKKSSELA